MRDKAGKLEKKKKHKKLSLPYDLCPWQGHKSHQFAWYWNWRIIILHNFCWVHILLGWIPWFWGCHQGSLLFLTWIWSISTSPSEHLTPIPDLVHSFSGALIGIVVLSPPMLSTSGCDCQLKLVATACTIGNNHSVSNHDSFDLFCPLWCCWTNSSVNIYAEPIP